MHLVMLSDVFFSIMRLNSQPESHKRWFSLQRRGEVVGGGNSTLGESPKRCLAKTLGTETVRKLASKQALGVRGIASHRK